MIRFHLERQKAFDKNLQAQDFVLIYQMGKVGSSSIEASLIKSQIPSWHLHTFDDNEEFQIYKNKKDVACFFDWPTRMAYKMTLAHRRRLLQRRKQLKIITLVRDPIATVTSRLFQDLHLHFIAAKKNLSLHGDIQSTLAHIENAFETLMRWDYFTHWFEREIQRHFNVDVLAHVNDPNQTHWHITQGGREILLMKCEAINTSIETLQDFLERPDFSLHPSNEATNKWYSALYREFKEKYPFERLFHLYQAPLYQTLYSEEEINGFKQKWTTR